MKLTSPGFINKVGSLLNIKRLGDKLHKACEIIPLENFKNFMKLLLHIGQIIQLLIIQNQIFTTLVTN